MALTPSTMLDLGSPAPSFQLRSTEGALVGRSIDDALRGPTRSLTALLQLRWGLPFRSVRY